MKQGKLVTTTNVQEADRCVRELQGRPKLEMVGLGLVYGAPGLGKTTWASRSAFAGGHVYIRLESTTTTKTFAADLFRSLNLRFGYGDLAASGASHSLFQRSLALLNRHPETVIVVDEIDYAFKQPKLLGAIRDLVDESLVIIILIGMENAMERLLQINRYYFDRCSQFYQFTPATLKDITQICATVMDVTPSPEVVHYIHDLSGGNLRQAVKIIDSIETIAHTKGIQAVSSADLREAK